MVNLEQLRTNTVNVPFIGAVSILAVAAAAGVAFILLRRKKSVKLTL